jgi:hypothetical protein
MIMRKRNSKALARIGSSLSSADRRLIARPNPALTPAI